MFVNNTKIKGEFDHEGSVAKVQGVPKKMSPPKKHSKCKILRNHIPS